MEDKDQQYAVGKISDATLRKLEDSGLRMTVQRRHIIDIMLKRQSASPKELWYEAREYVPDLGIATVYRLINRLEQIGLLSKQRNIGLQAKEPVLGTVTDGRGNKYRVSPALTLNEVVQAGLVAKGVLSPADTVQLTLRGDKVNVVVLK